MRDRLSHSDAIEQFRPFLHPVRRDDDAAGLADDFVRRVAKHVLGAGIPTRDQAVQRPPDDRVVGGFDDRGMVGHGVLRASALGDVGLHGHVHHAVLAVFEPGDGGAAPKRLAGLFLIEDLARPSALRFHRSHDRSRDLGGLAAVGGVQGADGFAHQFARAVPKHLFELGVGVNDPAVARMHEANAFRHVRHNLALQSQRLGDAFAPGDFTLQLFVRPLQLRRAGDFHRDRHQRPQGHRRAQRQQRRNRFHHPI